MTIQPPRRRENLVAYGTGDAAVYGMGAHVLVQVAGVGEGLVACVALERAFFGVGAHVLGQGAELREGTTAGVAFERAFFGVGAYVLVQATGRCERLVTFSVRALMFLMQRWTRHSLYV
jgi:hypothetical protein